MRFRSALRYGVLAAAVCVCLHGQTANELKGIPPRTSAGDYSAQSAAGKLTLAAEFKGHSMPDAQGMLTSEEYVAVEVGVFGTADARGTLSFADFSLRINGKKAMPAAPYGLAAASVKDPEWEPPVPVEKASKSKIGGGGGGQGNEAPTPPKPTFAEQRAWSQRMQKMALPEGDRPLPQAGLIFFQYRGQAKGIQTVELIYEGAAGKAVLKLQ